MAIIAKKTSQMILSVAAAGIVGYFLYHTVQGDRGWMEMLRLKNEVVAAEADLSQLQKQRGDLEHRIHLMRPDSMDPDLLDEQTRKAMDYTKPNEIVILTPQDKKKD